MAKKKKQPRQLTQAEIWDDSALQQSWDEAYEEYQFYHSIHARGERVADVLREAEGNDEDEDMAVHGIENSNSAVAAQTNGTDPDDLEEGELEDEKIDELQAAAGAEGVAGAAPVDGPIQPQPLAHTAEAQPSGTTTMPHPVLANVQDEALKNLMMSWYYAGYYTGLHEGQQRAARHHAETRSS